MPCVNIKDRQSKSAINKNLVSLSKQILNKLFREKKITLLPSCIKQSVISSTSKESIFFKYKNLIAH